MALSGFNRGKEDSNQTSTRPMPAASSPAPAGGNLSAFIDQGSEFEGKLSFKDTVRIDGRFKGEISSENTLIVGESGEIEASISSNTVVVSGSVMGDITAARQVVLHKNAQVEGNIETPSISVEEGAVFNGQIRMGRSDGKGKLKAISGGSEQSAPQKGDDAKKS